MNEKYIQAIILGSIIGLAIVFDDFVAPKPAHRMQQKHLMVMDGNKKPHEIKKFQWKGKPGKRKDLHEMEDHNVMIFKSTDGLIKIDGEASEIDISKIIKEVGKNLSEEDMLALKEKLKSVKKEINKAKYKDEEVNIELKIEIETD